MAIQPPIYDMLSRKGDVQTIAAITGYTPRYVRRVLRQKSENLIVYNLARDLVNLKKQLKAKYHHVALNSGDAHRPDIEERTLQLILEPARDGLAALQRDFKALTTNEVHNRIGELRHELMETGEWMGHQRLLLSPLVREVSLWHAVSYALLFGPDQDWVPEVGILASDNMPKIRTDVVLFKLLVRTAVVAVGYLTKQGLVTIDYNTNRNLLLISGSPCPASTSDLEKYNALQPDWGSSILGVGSATAMCQYVAHTLGGEVRWQKMDEDTVEFVIMLPKEEPNK
ncbi:hypothetical protein AB9P05_15680 [Roseivirga sp. BDSF3-8]|uniref:hypothetical protein n=1 Tax=Roseivirga sp. BDSF3-8 TaxID=3241598 RepID=UPI00353275AA